VFVVAEVLHEYVLPPEAVSVAVAPTQIAVGETTIEGTGVAFTETETTAEPVQPAVVPVKV
jgi:hypothetical protein